MNVPKLFERSVSRTPDRDAVVDVRSGTRRTYRELSDEVESVASELADRGIGAGDRVAICLPNRLEHVYTFLATQWLGAVAVPFNFRSSAEGIEYHVDDCDPEAFVFDAITGEDVASVRDSLDCESFVYAGSDPPEFAESFEELLDGSGSVPRTDVDGDDLSVILYTSGTTGDPKGIPITHEAAFARMMSNSLGQEHHTGERMLGIMPLYHTVGLHGTLCSMLSMSGTYYNMAEFDPEAAVRTVAEEGITALHEAPTILKQLIEADAADSGAFESVRSVAYSGAPMSTSLFEQSIDAFDPDRFLNIYGNTETYDPLEYVDLLEIGDPTAAGSSNVFHRTRIIELDATDPSATVDPGEEGQLIVHTDAEPSFREYWNKPAKTDAAIHDGWYFTGDAAYESEDGYVYVTGRTDDLIISGGENIHPSEVEDALASHPDVRDVGVVGKSDEEWGEIVTAYVDGDCTADELDQWCLDSDGLADFKRPREYEFVGEIPRNPSGKIMRYKLRQRE